MTEGFMPHGYCLHWDGPLLFVLIAGNLGIALAYFLIPFALRHFVGKRKDLPYPYMFRLFAAFILSCGLTHIAKVCTLYQPVYWVEASLDMWTAGVSLATAALLFPLIPQALSLRSPRELEEANRKLEAEIKERIKAEEGAQVARDEAIKANKLKSEFVANISHEIRTPMSGIIGIAELLTHSSDVDDVNMLSTRVLESSRRLLEVLNSLLDFSKLEAGKIQKEVVAFPLRQTVYDVLTLVQPNADAKNLKLEALIDLNMPEKLLGDARKGRHSNSGKACDLYQNQIFCL